MSGSTRRHQTPEPPQMPTGYRSTKRGSKALKQAKKAERQHKLLTGVRKTSKGVTNFFIVVVQAIVALLLTAAALLAIAWCVNTAVRWNAERVAAADTRVARLERGIRENILVVGVDGDKAVGFLAMRVDASRSQAFGVAIPDAAFLDVPGQGFQRIGEAYPSGADVVATTVSNYLTVPFRSYIVVPSTVYQTALTKQVVKGIAQSAIKTNMTRQQMSALEQQVGKIPQENVAIVPLPTRPINLGNQTYMEPQKAKVADLLKSWWGVDSSAANTVTRVVVYNGAGKPGIAGEAAQVLIRAGVRVIDTQNADSFNYNTTKILVRRGSIDRGKEIQKALGVGSVDFQPSDQNVTDVVVIIGKDYKAPEDSGAKESK